jgi:hypothetical protein
MRARKFAQSLNFTVPIVATLVKTNRSPIVRHNTADLPPQTTEKRFNSAVTTMWRRHNTTHYSFRNCLSAIATAAKTRHQHCQSTRCNGPIITPLASSSEVGAGQKLVPRVAREIHTTGPTILI